MKRCWSHGKSTDLVLVSPKGLFEIVFWVLRTTRCDVFIFSFIKEFTSTYQDFMVSFLHLQGRWEGGSEVLHQSILLLWPLEREDAAGHRGQEEGEAKTEGMCEGTQAQGPGNVQHSAPPLFFYAQLDICADFFCCRDRLRCLWWTARLWATNTEDAEAENVLYSPQKQIHVSFRIELAGWFTNRFTGLVSHHIA